MKSLKNILADLSRHLDPREFLKIFSRKVERALSSIRREHTPKKRGASTTIAIIATLFGIVMTGVGLVSFISLIISLLCLYFIFSKIFGIRFDLDDVVIV